MGPCLPPLGPATGPPGGGGSTQDPIPPLHIEVCRDGVIATVTVSGELDTTTAPGLTERLLKATPAHPERLVLDLDDLVFVDVAGARALDSVHRALEAECPVILRSPRPSARSAFRHTGLPGS